MKACLAVLVAAATVLPAHAQQAQPESEKKIELPHVDVTRVDSSVDPCGNFFKYVCTKLDAASPIPPDQVYWGVAGELQEWNLQVLRQILEKNAAASASRTPSEQKIGDFYTSCMAQAANKADDFKAIEPLLDKIAAMRDKREIAAVLATIHSSFGQVWNGDENQTRTALFGYGPTPDYNDVSNVVAGVDQGGLGLPGRDFYLKDDASSKAIRDTYVAVVVKMLEMAGADASTATRDAAAILGLETEMAQAQMDNVSRRDPHKLNNRYTLQQLKALTPAFDWDSYLHAMGAPSVPLYEVTSPDFFRALNKLLVSQDLATWKLYLRWQTLGGASGALGNAWRDAGFPLLTALIGLKQQPPDWRRCTNAVDQYVGQPLGQVYVEQVFPPDSKARALKMVQDIEAAMGRDIDAVTWMQSATKREAHLKLAAVMNKIGYPDHWIDYSSLSVERSSYPANVQRATAFELKRQLSFIGKPIDRTQWGMTPPTVNAYEDPQTNTINFPAGMLQPVYFDSSQDDVVNYGAEGSIVGHELTHAFDDQGRKYDLKGNLRDWWTPEDAKQYDARGECVAHEYTGPAPGVTGVEQNGKLTQGEDTADNGGIYLALSALAQNLKQQGKTLDDKDAQGLTNLQRFFLAYATSRCDQIQPELARTLVMTDAHSLPELRTNNVVGNMPEFQQAFGCKAGQPMVHATRCRVW